MLHMLSSFSLCYQDTVDTFVESLRSTGVNVWYDKDEVGFIMIVQYSHMRACLSTHATAVHST